MARKREPWQPSAAAAATAGPAGPRPAPAQLAQGARGRSVLSASALASGVLYEGQVNTPSNKPEYYYW